MKGKARLIGGISGSGSAAGIVTAKADAVSAAPVIVRAGIVGMPHGIGSRTQEAGLLHFLIVTPEGIKNLVWLNPQYGIDYTLDTSTNLKWQII